MGIKPSSRPKLTADELHQKIAGHNIDRKKYPIVCVGIRGYYEDTMGKPGQNDRGIYDDAIFLDSVEKTVAFNGNTDPAVFKLGIASLLPGLYYAHTFDLHRGKYLALCQRVGPVKITRDGGKEESGYFGINIHRGGENTTSSEGCQTIPPDQWDEFIGLATELAKKYFGANWKKTVIPYVLLEA